MYLMIDEHDDLDLGDIEALQGVCKFPARIKCATLGLEGNGKSFTRGREIIYI